MANSTTEKHYHTTDYVNGSKHVHSDADQLRAYLMSTVDDTLLEKLMESAGRQGPESGFGVINAMSVWICDQEHDDDE